MQIKRFFISILVLVPIVATAQFDFGGGQRSSKPWEEFKLPSRSIQLAFKNANVDSILSLFEKTSGITIIKDPALTGQITVTSAKAVPLKEAFQILSTTLSLKGFDMAKEGNNLVIRQRRQDRGRGGENNSGQPDWGEIMRQMGENEQPRPVLRVYRITHANASQVARVINDVFQGVADQNANNPFQMMFGNRNQGGRGGNNTRGGFDPRMFQRMGRGQATSSVRASSDDFSNSVIVNAPASDQLQVKELIDQLDVVTDQPQQSKVFMLEYADAEELAPVVQNVLVSNAPRGRGGIGTQNVPIEQRFQQAMRFGSAQAAFGQVVAEPRTNSLVVTATQENLDVIAQVIEELDQEVVFESSTFVFPLNNARADQVAGLLGQAFGQRQGTGTGNFNRGTGNFNNRNNQNNRNNRNNRNNNRNNLGGGFGGRESDPNSLELELEDELALEGELMTNIGVAQGFNVGGQRVIGGAGRAQGGTQQARDAQGRVVNVRDLTGQVTTIADPNTNSIIVVTSPENADVIRQILGQLDKIPEQVMIETIIVEATLDSSSKLGVEWQYAQSRPFGTPGTTGTAGTNFGLQNANPPLQGFRYTLSGGSLTAFINALQTDTKFQVLSTPRIFTSNNTEAEINISQSVPYVLSSREDANGNLTFNYAFQDVGIVLNVTPRITSNGYVTMDVTQTANDLQGFTSFNAPIVNQRQANTTVSVRDGETIILGGIIRSTVNATTRKIPLLGDIPILGNLFKTTDRTKAKTELMVFLTPRVVRDPDEARRLREESQQQLSPENQKSLGKHVPPPANNGGGDQKGNGGN